MQVERTRLYRVQAVADGLDISKATVYRAIQAGQLRAVRIGNGKGALRVPGEAITAYRAACEIAARVWTGLTVTQADGLACVTCGLDYRTSTAAHRPVGRSQTGAQVFACLSHDTPDPDTTASTPADNAAGLAASETLGEVA